MPEMRYETRRALEDMLWSLGFDEYHCSLIAGLSFTKTDQQPVTAKVLIAVLRDCHLMYRESLVELEDKLYMSRKTMLLITEVLKKVFEQE